MRRTLQDQRPQPDTPSPWNHATPPGMRSPSAATRRGLLARRVSAWTGAALLAVALAARAAPPTPAGFNVHLVRETESSRFWRGGAPRPDTLEALAAAAKKRGVSVMLIDLRAPAN